MGSSEDVLIGASTLRDFARGAVHAMGAPADVADEVARHLVEANLSGHDSHGVLRLPQYADLAAKGELHPAAGLRMLKEGPSLALFDAQRGFGQWSTRRVLEWCMAGARAHGMAAAAIRHSMHAGRLGDYAERACEQGLVAIVCLGVAGRGAGRVAPFGGQEGFLGTNPWAIGVPAGDRTPLIVDFATSAMAEGKLRVYRARGKLLPPGILLAPDGTPSDRPDDFYSGGSLLPLGGDLAGHKGYGLGMAAAMLGAVGMIGDAAPTPAGAMSGGPTSGFASGVFMTVLDPEWFGRAASYESLVGPVLDSVRGIPPSAGSEEVLVPGEPEARSRALRGREGVPIPMAIARQLSELGDGLGVPLPG